MCHKVTCAKCSKPTWAGCGNHIESALSGVPTDQRCKCRDLINTASLKATEAPAAPKATS